MSEVRTAHAQGLRQGDVGHLGEGEPQQGTGIAVHQHRVPAGQRAAAGTGLPALLEVKVATNAVGQNEVLAKLGVEVGDGLVQAQAVEAALFGVGAPAP